MADIITIANTDQPVDHKKYDENFERIFGGPKNGVAGKYVYKNGEWVQETQVFTRHEDKNQ